MYGRVAVLKQLALVIVISKTMLPLIVSVGVLCSYIVGMIVVVDAFSFEIFDRQQNSISRI